MNAELPGERIIGRVTLPSDPGVVGTETDPEEVGPPCCGIEPLECDVSSCEAGVSEESS